jgi:hypothetical protein
MKNNGRKWEAHVVGENQALHNEGLATVTRVPTHEHGGILSREPKVDFVGSISPSGRGVFFEAKSGSGVLTKTQKYLLAAHARNGALAFVYHAEGYVQLVGSDGKLGEKQTVERWYDVVG